MILVALAFFVQAQGVTLTAHAERLDKLMVELAKASGQNLKVAPHLAGEICAVAVHDAPLADVMTKLAEVTDGRWDQEGKTTYLVQSENALAAHRARALQSRESDIQRGINIEWPQEASTSGPGALPAALRDQDRFPIDELLLIQATGIEKLAQVPFGATVSLSTEPEPGELQMPAEVLDVIKRLSRAKEPGRNLITSKSTVKLDLFCPESPVERVIFLAPTIINPDTDGVVRLSSVVAWIYHTWHDGDARATPAKPGLVLSRMTRELAAAYALLGRHVPFNLSGSDLTLLQHVRERLRHPNQIDPLWYVSDLMMAVAESDHSQFVADLPDRSLADLWPDLCNPGTVAQEETTLSRLVSVSVKNRDQWLTASPRDPDTAARFRASRIMLAKVGSIVSGHTALSLTELASLVEEGLRSADHPASYEGQALDFEPVALWGVFNPLPNSLVLNSVDRGEIPFLSSLSDASFPENQPITLSRLSEAQRAFIVHWGNDFLPTGDPALDPSHLTVTLSRVTDLAILSVVRGQFARGNASFPDCNWFVSEPAGIAEMLEPMRLRIAGTPTLPSDALFQIGTRRMFLVSVREGDRLVNQFGWPIYDIDTNQKPVTLAELPPGVRDEIERERQKIRDQEKPGKKDVNPPQ